MNTLWKGIASTQYMRSGPALPIVTSGLPTSSRKSPKIYDISSPACAKRAYHASFIRRILHRRSCTRIPAKDGRTAGTISQRTRYLRAHDHHSRSIGWMCSGASGSSDSQELSTSLMSRSACDR